MLARAFDGFDVVLYPGQSLEPSSRGTTSFAPAGHPPARAYREHKKSCRRFLETAALIFSYIQYFFIRLYKHCNEWNGEQGQQKLEQREHVQVNVRENQHDGHQFPVVPLHPQEFRHHRP